MTVRLLKPYAQRPFNAITTFDASVEAGLIAAGQASADLTGGVPYYTPRPGLTLQAKKVATGTIRLKLEERATAALPEGQMLLVTGGAASTGTVQRLDGAGAALGSPITVGAGTLPPIGPFAGTQQFQITCTAGSIDATVGDAVLGLAAAIPDLTSAEKFALLGPSPVGFNYYSLLPDRYYSVAGSASSEPINLQYIADAGGKLVRVAISGFGASDYTNFIHSTSEVPDVLVDENLRATFKAHCDAVMDALAAKKLKIMGCILFGQSVIPTIFGESLLVAYGSTSSKTAIYARSWASWFARRYANHPAFGMISIGNEYVTDNEGAGKPSAVQLGAWFKFVADGARAVRASILVTANITAPVVVAPIVRTRETVEQSVTRYRTLFAGLDTYCLHIYGDNYTFSGHNASDAGTIPNAYYNSFGYEGVESIMQAYADMSRADGKPLIVGEWGVNTLNETDDPNGGRAAFVSDRKKWRLAKAILPYADTSLIWNVQLTSAAEGPGQAV